MREREREEGGEREKKGEEGGGERTGVFNSHGCRI